MFARFRNNSARELSVFAESAMAVKRVVMQHFSMNLALEARLRSLDEDSGLGHESEVVEMDTESGGTSAEPLDADETIQFGHLSLEHDKPPSAKAGSAAGKRVTFGLAPPSGSRLAQRRLKSCLSLDAPRTAFVAGN